MLKTQGKKFLSIFLVLVFVLSLSTNVAAADPFVVTFSGNGGTVTPATVNFDAPGTLNSISTNIIAQRQGFNLTGWVVTSGVGVNAVVMNITPAQLHSLEFTTTTSLIAQWTVLEISSGDNNAGSGGGGHRPHPTPTPTPQPITPEVPPVVPPIVDPVLPIGDLTVQPYVPGQPPVVLIPGHTLVQGPNNIWYEYDADGNLLGYWEYNVALDEWVFIADTTVPTDGITTLPAPAPVPAPQTSDVRTTILYVALILAGLSIMGAAIIFNKKYKFYNSNN